MRERKSNNRRGGERKTAGKGKVGEDEGCEERLEQGVVPVEDQKTDCDPQ